MTRINAVFWQLNNFMIIGIDASRANMTRRSGTEWYSYYLLHELAKQDSKNKYILYTDKPLVADLLRLGFDDSHHDDDSVPEHTFKSKFNNFEIKLLKWPFKYLWTQGRLSLEMLLNPPDVLFVPSHTLPIIHPKNSIVTIHDIAFERDRSIYQKRQIGADQPSLHNFLNTVVKIFTFGRYGANTIDYLAWSTIYGLRHASKIITVSEFTKKEIMSVYSSVLSASIFDKIRVVHNGFADELFTPNNDTVKADSILAKYNIVKPYLFYLGRIERKKNIPHLIEAFGLFQHYNIDANLVLTGASSFGADEVGYMISEYGLDKKVNRTGWVDEVDLPYIFNQATAFVFPSLHEGFGIPLLEAMACGIPVVASNAPAILEVCDGAALYFDPRNIRDMADKLNEIITNKSLRSALIKDGLVRSKKFSWRQCAKDTLNVICE